jgi:hypothetical protein
LAFISELNVQMLYLPGLQNLVPDFLSCPASILRQAGDVAEAVAAALIDFEVIAAKQLLPGKAVTTLTIALKKVGNLHLVGHVSTGISILLYQQNT